MIHFCSGSEYDRASEVVQESAESMNWIEDAVTILRERERELWMAKDEIWYIRFRAKMLA